MSTNLIIISSIFIFLVLLESIRPYRKELNIENNITNLLFGMLNKIIIVLIIPIHIYQTYFYQFNNIIRLESIPYSVILTVLVFDFFIYWQHRFFHMNNLLFKIHLPHHTDRFLNVTSGVRFHPLEIIISCLYKILLLTLFNPQLEHYLIYETCLLGFSLFNHSNINIPKRIEITLSSVFVTPLIHRSHHDQLPISMKHNYGNIFVFWDKIFGTFEIKEDIQYGISNRNYTSNFIKQLLCPFQK